MPSKPIKPPLKEADPTDARVIDLENRIKRLMADYENLEKRQAIQHKDFVKYANESLLIVLLPILDDLERAQSHLSDQGLNMVVGQLYKALEAEGITKIEPLGQSFDFLSMDCVEIKDGPENKVLEVHSPGYLYHDKVLRHAKVTVGKQTPEIKN